MNYHYIQKIGLIALALLLACSALADAVYTIEPTAVYVAEHGTTRKLGTLKAGTRVNAVDQQGGWTLLEKGSRRGYVRTSSLVRVTRYDPKTCYTKSSAPMYASFTKGAERILTIPEGEALTASARAGTWTLVEYDGQKGYVKTAKLTNNRPSPRQRFAWAIRDGVKIYSASGKVIARLSKGNRVLVVARKGDKVRVTLNGRTAYMYARDLTYDDPDATHTPDPEADPDTSVYVPAKGTAREMDWWTSDIQTIFARGVIAQITDVETGLTWWEVRYGGTNHADCQPLTAKDTAIMKKVYSGKWSWNRRAIFVTIGGVNYAASMNGMPHGGGSIKTNGFAGHHCIHFTNSRTHGSNRICPLHQAAIKAAAAAKLK